jgi:hypothetical protein
MNEVSRFLKEAHQRKIVSGETSAKLEALRLEMFAPGQTESSRMFGDLDLARDTDDDGTGEISEAPRFIRGFHDILITIGIVVAMGGLWALASVVAVIPAIIVLSEIFVKRQRLALPAFTLTIMLIFAVGMLIGLGFDGNGWLGGVGVFFGQLAAMALYYWRYRVPIALAGMIWAGFGLAFFVLVSLLGGDDQFFEQNPRLVGLIGLILSGGLFGVAMAFDVRDRMRVTRRSDVAFWLHLVTAPLLLYSAFIVLFGAKGFWWSDTPQVSEAVAAIAIVTLMVLIGIIIDRRAFVTSGLISLGAALGIITQQTGIDVSSISAFAFLAVGVIVLLLGSGWQKLRGIFVGLLPDALRDRIPPVAG